MLYCMCRHICLLSVRPSVGVSMRLSIRLTVCLSPSAAKRVQQNIVIVITDQCRHLVKWSNTNKCCFVTKPWTKKKQQRQQIGTSNGTAIPIRTEIKIDVAQCWSDFGFPVFPFLLNNRDLMLPKPHNIEEA